MKWIEFISKNHNTCIYKKLDFLTEVKISTPFDYTDSTYKDQIRSITFQDNYKISNILDYEVNIIEKCSSDVDIECFINIECCILQHCNNLRRIKIINRS